MSIRSKLRSLMRTAAFATGAAALAAAGPAWAHGSGHSGSQHGGFVNTIHPIVRTPTVNTIRPIVFHPPANTIHPIVRAPIVNTIRPIVATPVLSTVRPVLVHPPVATGSLLPPTGPIVRDHRGGGQGEGGVTLTSIPRPPSSSSWCIVSCGAHLGTPTYYNAGTTIRDHRTNPGGWGN